MKTLLLTFTIYIGQTLVMSAQASGSIVDHGDYFTDTTGQLDWLDLSHAQGMSYNDVLTEMQAGGSLEGWRYASSTEVYSLFDNIGGDGYYSDTNNGILHTTLYPVWGQMGFLKGRSGRDGESWFLVDDYTPGGNTSGMIMNHYNSSSVQLNNDAFSNPNTRYDNLGSALVRATIHPSNSQEAPLSAPGFLLAPMLGGLFAVRRLRKTQR